MDEVLNGNDDRLFARRLSDLITGRDPSGGSVVLTIDPAVQQAAYDALTSRDYAGPWSRCAADRADPRDGLHADLRPEQAGQPQLGRPDGGVDEVQRRGPAGAVEPGDLGDLSPRLHVQADRHRGGAAERLHPDSQLTAASEITLQDTATTLENFAGTAVRHGADGLAARRAGPLVQHRLRRARRPARRRQDPRQAEAFGVGTEPPAIPMTVAPSTLGDIPDTASLQQSAIGQRDVRFTPLQNAMIVAAIANGGQVMAPYLVSRCSARRWTCSTRPSRTGSAGRCPRTSRRR
jgi:peptidoglycan glycosyltransferase